MPEIEVHPTRRRVYVLAVDGMGPNAGFGVASIVKKMKAEGIEISRQAVEKHIDGLLHDRYIAKIRGTARPALYVRGEKAAILDALLGNPQCNPPNDGGRNVQNCRQPDNNISAYVPAGEAHIDGRYIFPVMKQGDLFHPVHAGDDKIVFDPKPKELQNGVIFYKGTVPLEDEDIKVQFWVGPEGESMHIWPTPVGLTPGKPHQAAEDLAEKAQMVANVLSKFGGWRFGLPRFVGEIHYATNDPGVVKNFPEGVELPRKSHSWLDGTPPPRAFETTSAEKMDGVINYHAIAEGLKATVARMQDQVESYRDSTLVSIRDNYRLLAETVELQHRILEMENIEMQRQAMHLGHGAEASPGEGTDPGVMYS